MIDTDAFETDVVIGEVDELGNIRRIDFLDQKGNQVDSFKYRAKKNSKSQNQTTGEN